ncbi:glutamine-hydrolyzing GMP synthase [Deinococcus soli (ex Cha et al. 2016)]|uniref:GMP synthase [glutamine-hydrolyzing] n=2 Tax=Deinococcus soli (ex Cha et al. 2016) TaxID=1309411 RepID=A0AAE4BPK1_9DEIO|nr:glutamine-hydrolyzing GMP synthase [Deinococcus soli (ex Cha et al. 2016)]MDR6220294.1 GMP synthase (glutamine-hydrolyzing) [Deinococcus soli (ex Cha et al. 2016)]MDR6330149.1 GMP synthase (glutamine-hydrolyzing) [Deinococcus soli (ex Cha et al. 2016)]MDR6752898.1 GMP synthase (glutamine-hydrolyzing) [Deinococcus soli (ex Cha et al. 2016)]
MSVVILDFGSQFTRLIARRFRELGAYSVILPGSAPLERILREKPQGIVLSGGPSSVYDEAAPKPAPGVLDLDIPVLGVCYGMQYLAQQAGGDVKRAGKREYGKADLTQYGGQLFEGIQGEFVAWMSHSDSVTQLPAGYEVVAQTEDTPVTAIENRETRRYGVQFHPEVVHTPKGGQLLANFLEICGVTRDWTAEHIIDELVSDVQTQVGDGRVLLAISGGVDSSTLGLLLAKAVGEKLTAVFIDHGLLRLGEREQVEAALKPLGVNLVTVDARAEFMAALDGVSDPEQKRKIIGREFIRAFEREARAYGPFDFLAQGTLYPDVIESAGGEGAANIKSHHNVGGLPDDLAFKLVEPFRTLFKDEVREIARLLGLPDHIRMRHPFPGPGLAIRCLGAISEEKLDILRRVDDIFISGLREFSLYDGCSQALAILTPIQSVGVMGDERTYSYTAALRAVTTDDFMTAEWARLPYEFLATMSNRIVNQVHEINRVVYDITGKPPATIEWE